MKINEDKIRKLSRPLFITALILSVIVIIVTIGFAVGNSQARASSYKLAKGYIEKVSASILYDKLDDYVRKNISEYEELPQVEHKLKEILENGELSVMQAEGFNANNPKYTVYIDGKEAYILTLERNIFLGDAYKVKSLNVSQNLNLGNDFVVDVPSGATVTVNGIELERAMSIPVKYYRLSEFEESLTNEYSSDRYSLGRFFLSPDVTVVYNGVRLSSPSIDNGALCYDFPSEMTKNYSFTVPDGAIIEVNGKTVDREYITEGKLPYPFLTRFESDMTGMPVSKTYELTGLFAEPEIKVTYNGIELTSKDGAYYLPSEMTKNIVIMAPDYAVVKLNGKTLGATEITAKKQELPILSGVSGYAKKRPYLTEYTVKGLLTEPTITAVDESGKILTVNKYYSSEGKLVFNCTSSGNPSSTVTKALTNYAKAYVKYVYSANSGLESNYNDAISYTPYSSLAYASLKETYRTLYNAPQYKIISYGTLKVSEYYKYSDSAYSAIVELPFTANRNGETVSLTVTLEILANFSGSRRWINYKVLNPIN